MAERDFAPSEVSFLQILAAQCAEALHRAMDYDRERRIAETLQRSLLPDRLPSIDGVTVDVRYHPAGADSDVGGDFYDVFTLDHGRVGVRIGDVSGKGIAAAATTALVRHTIRALARHGLPPAQVLAGANTALLYTAPATGPPGQAPGRDQVHGGPVLCTVAFLIVDPADQHGTIRVRCALSGHPHPFLLDPTTGTVSPVATPGTILGVFGNPHLVDSTITVQPGQQLVLYTDGYLDLPTDAGTRINPLPDLLARAMAGTNPAATAMAPTPDGQTLADAVQHQTLHLQRGHAHDDMALIVVTVTHPTPPITAPTTPTD